MAFCCRSRIVLARHERPPREGRPSRQQGGNAFARLQSDIRALNSSVLLLSQKMQYLVRNEKILGRNLIVLSKRLKEMEITGVQGSGTGTVPAGMGTQIEETSQKIESYGHKLLELQNDIEDLKERFASKEELAELKYVIDAINPLEFVTQKQLAEVKGKFKKRK